MDDAAFQRDTPPDLTALPETVPPRRSPVRAWIPLVLLVVAVSGIYGRSVGYPFIGFDDTTLIAANQEFLTDARNLGKVFTQHAWTSPTSEGAGAYYRPLLVLSFMWDAHLGGARPWGYHVTNLALHIAAALLVFLFLARLLGEPSVALFFGLAVAVHPALAEVVSWVPGRNESLLAMFIAASMLALDRHVARRDPRSLGAHLALSLLALLTKEHAVALAVVVPAFVRVARGGRLSEFRGLWIGWAVIVGGWLAARAAALAAPLPVAPGDLLRNAWANALVPIHYVGKTFLPVSLSVMPTVVDTPLWPGLVGFAAVGASLLWARAAERRVALFGCLWFVVFVLPTLPAPVMVGQEPRMFTPMIGLLLAVSPLALRAARFSPRPAAIVGVATLAALGVAAASRVSDFSSREHFWRSAVSASPHSSLALMNLGSVCIETRRLAEAESLSRRALEVNPREPKAENNLAIALAAQGRSAEAEGHFLREIQTNPRYADAYFNLGTLLHTTGRADQAAERWREALARKPGHARALQALARYHLARGEHALAQPYLDALKRPGPRP